MFTAGMYIEATPDEFVRWFTDWFHGPSSTLPDAIDLSAGCQLSVGAELGQHLVAAIKCELPGSPNGLGLSPSGAYFQILPVGLGRFINVTATCAASTLQPWMMQAILAITARWPASGGHIWFNEPPSLRTTLAALKIRATARTIEVALQRWAASYRSAEVSSVGVLWGDDPPLPRGASSPQGSKRNWHIKVSLERGNFPWQAVDSISIKCEMSRIPGRYPILLTISQAGIPYREIEPLAVDLVRHCQALWDTQRVAPMATGSRRDAKSRPGAQIQPMPSTQRRLTPDDKPWEFIPELSWDRAALRLWWLDHSCPAIARQLHVSTKTITNRLSELRTMYGTGIVPTDWQRRNRREKEGYLG
jgi:hypothetical protein